MKKLYFFDITYLYNKNSKDLSTNFFISRKIKRHIADKNISMFYINHNHIFDGKKQIIIQQDKHNIRGVCTIIPHDLFVISEDTFPEIWNSSDWLCSDHQDELVMFKLTY